MLLVVLFLAILSLAVAGIGGGMYLIARPNRIVGNGYSPSGRPMLVVALRVAGAAMVGISLLVLYLTFWTVTCGPCSGE